MHEPLIPRFTHGTHRLLLPEQTLLRLEPLLEQFGITRLADISGLDVDLGVPTYTAIRPGGLVLQTGNGKGLNRAAAKASALMEAIELYHAENPEPGRLVRASQTDLEEAGIPKLVPERDRADRRFYFGRDYLIDWVEAEELVSGQRYRIPASAAYFVEPTVYRCTTNGLAGGNHLVEATLHALYELLERDAVSRLVVGGKLDIAGSCRSVDTASISDEALGSIIDKIHTADSKLVLLWVPTRFPVHCFWAVLLNRRPFRAITRFCAGFGAHPNLEVAAARAVTEAIQSRLTLIQTAREDIVEKPPYARPGNEAEPAYRYFDELSAETPWEALKSLEPIDLPDDLRTRLACLVEAISSHGHPHVLRVRLEKAGYGVPVVKLIVPGLGFIRELF